MQMISFLMGQASSCIFRMQAGSSLTCSRSPEPLCSHFESVFFSVLKIGHKLRGRGQCCLQDRSGRFGKQFPLVSQLSDPPQQFPTPASSCTAWSFWISGEPLPLHLPPLSWETEEPVNLMANPSTQNPAPQELWVPRPTAYGPVGSGDISLEHAFLCARPPLAASSSTNISVYKW